MSPRTSLVALCALSLSCHREVPTPPPVAQPAPPPRQAEPPRMWWHDAVFYEVFVRSFQDSDGDGIGDLRGLLSRLDYLNDGDPATHTDLGVTALWLMPIFESPSYHGYDTTNFDRVDPDYGTEEDLKALLDACHARGIKVIVDLMLNHTSSQHPWFIESAEPGSPRASWYLWSDTDPGWRQPWGGGPTWHKRGDRYYYGVFWSGMPDLNFTEPAVEQEMIRVADFWLDRGIDGFRLDAIKHLVEEGSSAPDHPLTHTILKRYRAALKAEHPEALLIGEIWSGPDQVGPYYGQGDELDLAFDFGTAGGLVQATRAGDTAALLSSQRDKLTWLPVQGMSAPFLTNHDQDRIAGLVGGDVARLKLAAELLLTLPGVPFLYYGEEIGLRNTGVGGDEAKRAPMQWEAGGLGGFTTAARAWTPPLGGPADLNVASQLADPTSLLSHYRQLIGLRQANPALRGTIHHLPPPGEGGAMVLIAPGQLAVVRHNPTSAELPAASTPLDLATLAAAGLTPSALPPARVVWGRGQVAATPTDVGLTLDLPPLPPMSVGVVVVGG